MRFRSVVLALLCLLTGVQAIRAEDKPARIFMGLASADRLIEDLEYIVVQLAGEKEQWEKNVLPNLEVFLIEVLTDKPVRMDTVIDATDGQRSVFVIPVEKASIKGFLDDNLGPIGINARRAKGDKGLYELSGDVLEKGWLREAFDYATISTVLTDVPATIPDPQEANAVHFESDPSYDVAVQLLTTKDDVPSRKKAIEKLRSESDANLKTPNEGESDAAFQLRKALANQQLDSMDQIFVQSQELFFGWITDPKAKSARGTIRFAALEGTKLYEAGSELGTKPSYFAAIPQSEDPVLKGRITLNLGERSQKRIAEIAKLSQPVAHEKIDKKEGITAEQKAARKAIMTTLLTLLEKNAALGVLDAFGELTAQPGGKHVFVAGLRANEGAAIKEIVEQLPKSDSQWVTKVGVEKVGDIEVHHIQNTKPSDVVKDFWGTGDIYIAAGPESVWIAKGQGSLDVLKASIEKLKGTPDMANMHRFASLRMHAKPILYINESFWEELDIDLKKLIQSSGLMPKKKEAKATVGRDGKKQSTADKLKNYDWADPALKAMEGKVDVIDIVLDHDDDKVNGMIDIQVEVLKALGTVIADFAEKNLQ